MKIGSRRFTFARGFAFFLANLACLAPGGGMLIVVTHADAVAERVGRVRRLVDGRLQ